MLDSRIEIHVAEEGKVYKRILTGEILDNKLSFDVRYDSISNYVEVDRPLKEEV